ncbi:MAG: hypothetical protein J6A59_05050 [Lachnospiraceae bacterium]|nr:hypothetical protein [Lachnospiraceae bacterium]
MKIDKKDYPKMPDDIRDMIKQQVENEISSSETKVKSVSKGRFVRYAVAALAGTLLVGTTVYAASKLISITTEKKGEYGLETKVTVSENLDNGDEKENVENQNSEGSESTVIDEDTTEVPYDRYELMNEENYVHIDISYMPEDVYIQWTEDVATLKLHSYSEMDRENRSMTFYMWRIHEGVEYTHNDVNVVNTEEFEVPGGTAVLVELDGGTRKVYMAYDIGYVLDIWAQPGITKDEFVNVAKGISLEVATKEEAEEASNINFMMAPAYVPPFESVQEGDIIYVETEDELERRITVAKDELKVYQVGEEFGIPEKNGNVKVTKVEICDDLSVVNKDVFDFYQGEYPDFIDENGKLRDEVVSYCKVGDGVNFLDEVVASETIPVKLVYIEVEYTSDTGTPEMLFYGNLMLINENNDSYEIYDGLSPLARSTEYDVVRTNYYRNEPEEIYFYNGNDVWEKNHFEIMQAGETRTASFCYVVREDWLPYMYFDITCADPTDYFKQSILDTGVIDIRQ